MRFSKQISLLAVAVVCTLQAGCHDATVTCEVAISILCPPNNKLVDVGLTASEDFHGDPDITIEVWSDENAPGDAEIDTTAKTLELRAQRDGNGDGRVYLIIAKANNEVDCCWVVVPHDESKSSLAEVTAQAATAEAQCTDTGNAPANFTLIAGPSIVSP